MYMRSLRQREAYVGRVLDGFDQKRLTLPCVAEPAYKVFIVLDCAFVKQCLFGSSHQPFMYRPFVDTLRFEPRSLNMLLQYQRIC